MPFIKVSYNLPYCNNNTPRGGFLRNKNKKIKKERRSRC